MTTPALTPDNLPPGVPPEAVPELERVGFFAPDRLHVDAEAPDATVYTLAGDPVRLSTFWAARPAVLIFGSYT